MATWNVITATSDDHYMAVTDMEIHIRINSYNMVDVIHENEHGILIVDETVTPPVIPQAD